MAEWRDYADSRGLPTGWKSSSAACRNEERLLEASYSFDDLEIVRLMKKIVPEFKSQHSKYELLDK